MKLNNLGMVITAAVQIQGAGERKIILCWDGTLREGM